MSFKSKGYTFCGLLLLLWLLAGCAGPLMHLQAALQLPPPPAQGPLPPHRIYVLAGSEHNNFVDNALTIVDTTTWRIYRHIPLPKSEVIYVSRDPQGQLWLGLAGGMDFDDKRVQVYSPEGNLLATLPVCVLPHAGISFAAGHAFIACSESGFTGKVTVINLNTLQTEKEIPIESGNLDLNFLAVASAANEHAVLVSALTRGPDERAPYCLTAVIDPHTLTLQTIINRVKNCHITTMLPTSDAIYLLNSGSGGDPAVTSPTDLLVWQPTQPLTLTQHTLPTPAPVWGMVAGDMLYAYHNHNWNSPRMQSDQCAVSRRSLQTGEQTSWTLPAAWYAYDLAVIHGDVFLSHWSPDDQRQDGLYQFDPATSALTLKVNILGAEKLLVVP